MVCNRRLRPPEKVGGRTRKYEVLEIIRVSVGTPTRCSALYIAGKRRDFHPESAADLLVRALRFGLPPALVKSLVFNTRSDSPSAALVHRFGAAGAATGASPNLRHLNAPDPCSERPLSGPRASIFLTSQRILKTQIAGPRVLTGSSRPGVWVRPSEIPAPQWTFRDTSRSGDELPERGPLNCVHGGFAIPGGPTSVIPT